MWRWKFLKAIVERQEKLNLNLDITGVELCLDEAKKAMRYGTNVECQDFLHSIEIRLQERVTMMQL